MKIKNILIAVFAASMALVACNKAESVDVETVDTTPKSVTVTFPNVSPQTKATGDAVANGSKAVLNNFKVFFLDASGAEVTDIPDYPTEGIKQKVYFSNDAGIAVPDTYTYHFLPYGVSSVAVVGNVGDLTYEQVKARTETVQNDEGTGKVTVYPLYGEAPLVKGGSSHTEGTYDPEHTNIYTATVNLVPRVARFEVYKFEYEGDAAIEGTAATDMYESVAVKKIALNSYYPSYTFVSAAPAGGYINAEISGSNAWDWVNDQVAPWADAAPEALVLAPDAPMLPDGTLADDTNNGEGAKGIFTYGLTKGTAPQLVVTLLGKKGDVETPLYLYAKSFENMGTVTEGKIYRVNFAFDDQALDQPERCVELTVDVLAWEVVAVTPAF